MDLVLACYLNPSGLSRAAREYYRLFVGEGFRVIPVWLMEPTPEGVDEELAQRMLSAAGRPINESPIEVHVGLPHALRSFKGAKAILGSCVFENHLLTQEQLAACRHMTAVMVPSSFCRNACLASGLPKSKVSYLPYPLDSRAWNASIGPSEAHEGRFRFLYLNSWYQRKGYDVLFRAWWRTFKASDPVELWVKSYREEDRPRPLNEHIDRLASEVGVSRSNEAPVRTFDEVVSDRDLPGFMRSCDCYVSPHRAEGFGMNVWYAMALGIPVICSDYGGTTDFAKEDTAWLVPRTGMSEPGREEARIFPHLRGIRWAEPDVDALCERMKSVLTSPDRSFERAKNAYDYVHSAYAPSRVLNLFKEGLERAVPGAWAQLSWTKELDSLADQESPRFESVDEPIRMLEI